MELHRICNSIPRLNWADRGMESYREQEKCNSCEVLCFTHFCHVAHFFVNPWHAGPLGLLSSYRSQRQAGSSHIEAGSEKCSAFCLVGAAGDVVQLVLLWQCVRRHAMKAVSERNKDWVSMGEEGALTLGSQWNGMLMLISTEGEAQRTWMSQPWDVTAQCEVAGLSVPRPDCHLPCRTEPSRFCRERWPLQAADPQKAEQAVGLQHLQLSCDIRLLLALGEQLFASPGTLVISSVGRYTLPV